MGTSESYDAVFATQFGICTGGAGGRFKNLTQDRIVFPYAESGAGIVIDQQGTSGRPERFICTIFS